MQSKIIQEEKKAKIDRLTIFLKLDAEKLFWLKVDVGEHYIEHEYSEKSEAYRCEMKANKRFWKWFNINWEIHDLNLMKVLAKKPKTKAALNIRSYKQYQINCFSDRYVDKYLLINKPKEKRNGK